MSRHVQDGVGIDVDSDFNLWDTSWRCWDPVEVKLAQETVVLLHCALTRNHLDQKTSPVVAALARSAPSLLLLDALAQPEAPHPVEPNSRIQLLNFVYWKADFLKFFDMPQG